MVPFRYTGYVAGAEQFDAVAILAPDDPDQHGWYAFPELTTDEVVVYQEDGGKFVLFADAEHISAFWWLVVLLFLFVGNADFYNLPRKFKIAFSGCKQDCALTPIHDIGLLAAKRVDGTIGFRMVAGGGLGSAPRLAQVLREFTPMDELIPSVEAVIRVFDTLGNRKNRTKARMKFVIEKK